VWHVAILRNDFQALDGFGISNDVVEEDGTVLFNPFFLLSQNEGLWQGGKLKAGIVAYHGSS